MVFETNSSEETYDIGYRLAKGVAPGTVIALTGDLGVGKTVFTQGFAAGLGVKEHVNSPTFTIVQVYDDGRMPFYHFDVYRISDVSEMDEIGYEEYFYGDGVCLVEWAELIRDIMPEDYLEVTIEKDFKRGVDFRKITFNREVLL